MSAPILHGRRKGSNRGSPEHITAHLQLGAQSAHPQTRDLRQVTVLNRDDWNRIQFQLNKRAIQQENVRQAREDRERMRQMSKERVNNWSNTFAGQRQKKLEARKIREDKEEDDRKLVDIEEAKFQAEKRKGAIEKAKTQQYYQTDRVKGFHGALLLTEVLKERDAQVELKQLKEQASKDQDHGWLLKAEREYEEAILKDQDGARDRIHKARDMAQFQKAQINHHLREKDIEAEHLNIEGEELKRLAVQYEMEKKRLAQIREAEAQQMMSDNLKQIGDVRKMREIHQQQEEEEDEECRIFAAAKRKMMKLRGQKEKELHNEKQERLESIRQKLYAQMQQKKDDEDERTKRALEEAEERRAREEAQKEAYSRKMLGDIAEHRYEQLQEKEHKAAEDRRRELEMLAVRREADELFAQNEQEKNNRRFKEMKELQSFHNGQIDDRQYKEQVALEEQLELDKRNDAVVQLEEKQFQEYARRVIDHCDKGGRNTHPLKKAAKEGAGGGLGPVFPGKGGVRPSYMVSDQSGVQMPNYQRGTTDETKKNIHGNAATHKRLGFVW